MLYGYLSFFIVHSIYIFSWSIYKKKAKASSFYTSNVMSKLGMPVMKVLFSFYCCN